VRIDENSCGVGWWFRKRTLTEREVSLSIVMDLQVSLFPSTEEKRNIEGGVKASYQAGTFYDQAHD
jgi:hypothetical protein